MCVSIRRGIAEHLPSKLHTTWNACPVSWRLRVRMSLSVREVLTEVRWYPHSMEQRSGRVSGRSFGHLIPTFNGTYPPPTCTYIPPLDAILSQLHSFQSFTPHHQAVICPPICTTVCHVVFFFLCVVLMATSKLPPSAHTVSWHISFGFTLPWFFSTFLM